MPVQVTRTTDIEDLYIAKPDLRYGVTFLSNKFRDHAVNGETLQDKHTGEIFTKRPSDGRVISFHQHNRSLNDIILDLRILMNTYDEYTYPDADSHEDGFLFVTDYDLMQINKNKIVNALDGSFDIPNNPLNLPSQLIFRLSKDTNAFFLELDTRFRDKPIINFASSYYNRLIQTYTGEDEDYIIEQEKFDTEDRWEDSDATVYYTTTLYDVSSVPVVTIDQHANIRMNERSCVFLPVPLLENIQENNEFSIEVKITGFTFNKVSFLYDHMDDFPTTFKDKWNEIIEEDRLIYVNYASVMGFVDNEKDINLVGNDILVTMMDIPYVFRTMDKLWQLKDPAYMIMSAKRPKPDKWKTHSIWGEMIRHVYRDGAVINRNCEVDLDLMNRYFAPYKSSYTGSITKNVSDKKNYLLNEQTYVQADISMDESNPSTFLLKVVERGE